MHRGSTERAGDRRSPDFRHYSLSLIAESLSRSRQNSRSASSMATSSSPKHGVSSTGNIRLKLLPSTSRSRWVSSPTATIRSEAKVFPGLDIAVANVQRRRRCQSFHREPCTRRSKSIPRWSASAKGWPPAPGLSWEGGTISAKFSCQAPALCAKCHDAWASIGTRAAISAALALDALPSIQRFLMPWTMPSRRNRL